MNVANVRPEQTTARITDDGHVYWRGYGGVIGDEREYVLDIRLLKPIKTAESSIKLSSRLVYFKIRKAESGPYWDRLLADESRNVHCKIDWDAWKDEDEEDDYDFGTWLPFWQLHQGRGGVCWYGRPWQALSERAVTGFRRAGSVLCHRSLETVVLVFILGLTLTCSAESLLVHSFTVTLGLSIPFFPSRVGSNWGNKDLADLDFGNGDEDSSDSGEEN